MAGKILIVDDVATNRIVLKVKLAAACYDTLQAETGAAALAMARDETPDLILLDVMLPDVDGVDVCRALKADPATRDIPIIMVTAFNDFAARMQALSAGADDFLSKPLDDLTLLARLRSLLRARETSDELRMRDAISQEFGFADMGEKFVVPGLVGIVSQTAESTEDWRKQLLPHVTDHLVGLTRADALADGHGPVPDVFLIAADLFSPGEGLRLMSELRSRPATRHSAVCLILPRGARETAAMALDLGANDLVPDSVDPQECALRLSTLMRRKRQSDLLRATLRDGLRLSVTDPLTGLYNRRYALPHLNRMAVRSAETERAYAVMLIDLDHFKEVNDNWGHAAGDAVLAEIAGRMRDNMRGVDLVARIGGEEFLIAMPDATLAEAEIAAERLRRITETSPVRLSGGRGEITVTLSIGLALGKPGAGSAEMLMEQADAALLRAKAGGRNRVVVGGSAAIVRTRPRPTRTASGRG